ncbi:MAG TPA: ComF family protein [Bacteroidales bacterium]|nr:ComF family protein [Bacteroidales bacterium]
MSWLRDFLELIYPKNCGACNVPLLKGESVICTQCMAELPFTHYHKMNDNPVAQVFWGRIPIENATSLLYFHKKGRTQHLLHQLKYKGRQDIGIFLGQLLGNQLLNNEAYQNIDAIVPIPLHPKRQKQRGYNQAECIAIGLSRSLNIPIENQLIFRNTETKTQTKKSRTERWENVAQVFSLNTKNQQNGKHYLLVDDVITTGATIEACAQTLLTIPGTKISVASLAKA